MSIKLRLLLSYLIMLIVPVILALAVIMFSGLFYINDIQKKYNGQSNLFSPRRSLSEGNELFSLLKKESLISPDSFEDNEYLSGLERSLESYYAGIIVRKNGRIIYSSPLLKDFSNINKLPAFGEFQQNAVIPFNNSQTGVYLNQQDFYFSDKSEGSMFLIIDLDPFKKAFQEMLLTDVVLIIIILILTNGVLTYFVAGSIIKPLNRLKASVYRIRDGNLNFQVKADGKDEISEVGHAVEDMRVRLKNSLDVQLQYEENRKELMSNITHDLKTPITTIKGYVEGIRDGIADTPEKMNKYINTVYAKTVYVDKLIDELFLYSKLDMNKQPLFFIKVDLQKFLSDIVEEQKFDLEKESVTLNYNSGNVSSAWVLADVQQLRRVVANVLENSVKYKAASGGRIEINLEEEKELYRIEIKDNGKGISKKELPFVFDRFFRGDPSRNSSTGGSGLGLAIAKKIIEEHGGNMWVESVEGESTSIFITLNKI